MLRNEGVDINNAYKLNSLCLSKDAALREHVLHFYYLHQNIVHISFYWFSADTNKKRLSPSPDRTKTSFKNIVNGH